MPSATSEPTYVARRIETAVSRHPAHLADGYRDAKHGRPAAADDLADALDALSTLANSHGAVASIIAHAAGVVLARLDDLAPRHYRG